MIPRQRSQRLIFQCVTILLLVSLSYSQKDSVCFSVYNHSKQYTPVQNIVITNKVWETHKIALNNIPRNAVNSMSLFYQRNMVYQEGVLEIDSIYLKSNSRKKVIEDFEKYENDQDTIMTRDSCEWIFRRLNTTTFARLDLMSYPNKYLWIPYLGGSIIAFRLDLNFKKQSGISYDTIFQNWTQYDTLCIRMIRDEWYVNVLYQTIKTNKTITLCKFINSSTMQLNIPNSFGTVACRLFNLSGRLIAQWNDLPPGVHLLQVPAISMQPYLLGLKSENKNLCSTLLLVRR